MLLIMSNNCTLSGGFAHKGLTEDLHATMEMEDKDKVEFQIHSQTMCDHPQAALVKIKCCWSGGILKKNSSVM